MTTKTLTTFVIGLTLFTGCSKDDGGSGDPETNCNNLEEVFNAYSEAVNAVNTNPTEANCNNMKEAAIDLIETTQNCSTFSNAELEEAANEWENVDCSEMGS